MTKNQEISDIFNAIADILEFKGENRFRIRAYRRAALSIANLSSAIETLDGKKAFLEIPGIGSDLADKIMQYLETGKVAEYEKLKKTVPAQVSELMRIPGVGPKLAKSIQQRFRVKNIRELQKLARAGKLLELPHFKEKMQENILKGINILQRSKEQFLLSEALTLSERVLAYLKTIPSVTECETAGSLRRRKEVIHDIDIVVATKNAAKAVKEISHYEGISQVLAQGSKKISVILKEGIQLDVRMVRPQEFGAALVYLTGSKAHNITIRERAVRMGYKINEYGVFNKKGKCVASAREADVYKAIGLAYIPPEMREDRGEVDAALEGTLPALITKEDIISDLHVHSRYSDGLATIEEVALQAKAHGLRYIAICDHSQSLVIAHGLSEKRLLEKIREIDTLNKKNLGIRILKGAEVDILSDGSLDYPDALLEQLDFVVAAIHTGFKQSKEKITERIVKAMHNKHTNTIAHPSGRLIGERDPYEVDMEAVIRAARATNTALEINAFPKRLDLTDVYCKRAKEEGVKFSIGTDSHMTDQMRFLELGASVARRGWLEKKDVLNTLPLKDFFYAIDKA
jgi:DNA polymerase (family 10)